MVWLKLILGKAETGRSRGLDDAKLWWPAIACELWWPVVIPVLYKTCFGITQASVFCIVYSWHRTFVCILYSIFLEEVSSWKRLTARVFQIVMMTNSCKNSHRELNYDCHLMDLPKIVPLILSPAQTLSRKHLIPGFLQHWICVARRILVDTVSLCFKVFVSMMIVFSPVFPCIADHISWLPPSCCGHGINFT